MFREAKTQKTQIQEMNNLFFDPLVCVKCGYCKSTCPTYLAERDERFSPRGRLMLSRSLIEEDFSLMSFKSINTFLRIYNDLDTCSKCAECEKTCPVGLKPWLNFVRAKNKTLPGKIESFLARKMVKNKFIFSFLMRIGMTLRGSHLKIKSVKHSPVEREAEEKEKKEEEGKYIFFPTCFGSTVFKESTERAMELLSMLRIEFRTPKRSFLCCGAPLLLSGDEKNFSEHVDYVKKHLFDENENIKGVLVSGATCTWVMREFYGKMPEVHETSDFIIRRIKTEVSEHGGKNRKKVRILVHTPCHQKYPSEDKESFLKGLGFDVERTEFPCCGFGGSMFFKQVKMSKKLLGEILKGKKADVILSNSPGCVIQLSSSGKYVELITDFLHRTFFQD